MISKNFSEGGKWPSTGRKVLGGNAPSTKQYRLLFCITGITMKLKISWLRNLSNKIQDMNQHSPMIDQRFNFT